MSVQSGMSAASRTALVVEDDEGVRRMLERHLSRAGFVVRLASGEGDALRLAEGADIAIVDLGLAQGTGAALCERIRDGRTTSTMPLLVLTARDDLETKLRLFAAGADDYLTKPFEPLELLARIDATGRRAAARPEWRRIGPLEVSEGGDAVINGTPLALTAAEREVVSRLAGSYPGAASHESLRRGPWRRSAASSDNVIEVVVGRIRKKLAAAGGGVEIRVVRGAGYVLRIARSATSRSATSRSEGMVGR
ncbi:MAG: response regulator transcription factor [Candidatus Limnocylindria bacterium]